MSEGWCARVHVRTEGMGNLQPLLFRWKGIWILCFKHWMCYLSQAQMDPQKTQTPCEHESDTLAFRQTELHVVRITSFSSIYKGLPWWLSKESACKAGDPGLIPGLGRFPWRREWQPTPVFLPGESHGQTTEPRSRTQLSD